MSFDNVTWGAVRSDPEEIENPNAELARADAGFTGPDIETDMNAIAETIFGRIADRIPNWQAHDGNPDVWLVEAFSAVTAEIRALAKTVPESIFITFMTEALGRPIRSPVPATATSRWVAMDDRGYTIDPGTQISVPRTGDEFIGFEVVTGATISPGETFVDDVEIVAIYPGALANGLWGRAELADPLDWVREIILTAPSAGGDDGQDRDEFLQRTTQLLRILAFRPILPYDFALLALDVPGVGRAVAMDTFDPKRTERNFVYRDWQGFRYRDLLAEEYTYQDLRYSPEGGTGTWGHARTVAVVVTGPDGLPLPRAVKREVERVLEDGRELGFNVTVVDANYQTVDVTYEVTAFHEQDPDFVRVICDETIREYLNPARYRLGVTSPAIEGGEVIPPGAATRRWLRVNDIVGALDRARGVDWVGPSDVLINGQHADYQLQTVTSLPLVGQIQGTVNVG